MPRTDPDGLPVLGWKEQVALPDWGVGRLRAKLDTGARSSALHVESLAVEPVDHAGSGGFTARFTLAVGSRDRPQLREVCAPVVAFKVVRDSGGNTERRPVVRTHVRCGPLDLPADITLTDRTGMNFRMLLGRLTLQGHCLVDPEQGYRVSPQPARRRRG